MPVPTPASVKKTLDEKRASENTPQVVTIKEKKTPKGRSSRQEDGSTRSPSTKKVSDTSKSAQSHKKSVPDSVGFTKSTSTSLGTSESTDRSRPNKGEAKKATERRPPANRPLLHNPALAALKAQMNKAVTDLGYEEVK